MLTVYSVYTVGLHDNIGTWYTSNEKKCVWSRKKVLISGMRKDILVAGFLEISPFPYYGVVIRGIREKYVELVFILQIPFVYEKINLYFIEISILNT